MWAAEEQAVAGMIDEQGVGIGQVGDAAGMRRRGRVGRRWRGAGEGDGMKRRKGTLG